MSVRPEPQWQVDMRVSGFKRINTRANEAERTHIMLDLDMVADAASAARFLMRHGATLRDMLVSTEIAEALDRAETADQEANEAEAAAARFKNWIEDLADQLSPIADEVFDLGERGEAEAAKLQKIIETADALTSGAQQ